MTWNSKRIISCIVLTIVFLVLLSPLCLANSAEPPSVIIVVQNAPEDLALTIDTEFGEIDGNKEKKFMQTQFSFYSFNYDKGMEYSVKIAYGDVRETLFIGSMVETYMNVFELDYKNMSISRGTAGYRIWLYTAVRILLTLAIEAVIFFLFWYRKRKSWIIFILINLITQGGLNLWLNTFSAINSYLILVLIIGEAFVFIAEIIGFLVLIKEHKKLRTLLYVIIANIVSLILGGYLITLMPM
ncbi:MAG: hypothetical protein R3232_04710 [Clostridia bacterium]|nr:hypothetical protein [Clostridia bacterium]